MKSTCLYIPTNREAELLRKAKILSAIEGLSMAQYIWKLVEEKADQRKELFNVTKEFRNDEIKRQIGV